MPDEGKRLIAGAMSGTSADGVDVAIVEVAGRGLEMTAKPVAHAYEPFTPELRTAVLAMRQDGRAAFSDLARVGREVTLAYVRAFRSAIAKANVTAADIAAIGAHGQTLWHGPPNTIQYFDPSLLAIETGCAVVSDFRRADLAVGGQGAPLVPFADWILFRHPTKSRVILNIGGIANLTYLKAGGSIDEVIAFDTGPGNCISDWLMRDAGGVDLNGELARQGLVSAVVLQMCLSNAYFRLPAPKSTDGPAMIEIFSRAAETLVLETRQHQLATAAELTARSITAAVCSLGCVDEVLAAGGGTQNGQIMTRLAKLLNRHQVPLATAQPWTDVASLGVDFRASREAIAFALLAAATLNGEPSNVPSATGATRRVVLGSITPRPV